MTGSAAVDDGSGDERRFTSRSPSSRLSSFHEAVCKCLLVENSHPLEPDRMDSPAEASIMMAAVAAVAGGGEEAGESKGRAARFGRRRSSSKRRSQSSQIASEIVRSRDSRAARRPIRYPPTSIPVPLVARADDEPREPVEECAFLYDSATGVTKKRPAAEASRQSNGGERSRHGSGRKVSPPQKAPSAQSQRFVRNREVYARLRELGAEWSSSPAKLRLMLRESGMEGVSEKRLRTMKARATSSAQTGGAASKVASKVRGVVEPSMPRRAQRGSAASKVASKVRGVVEPSMPRRARSTIPAHVTPPSEDEQFERKLRGFVKTRMQKVRRATRVVEAD
jgi:hypothetical protein